MASLYLISQDTNNDYDTYDSAVVCADDLESARLTHPGGDALGGPWNLLPDTWVSKPEHVTVTYLGEADPSVEYGVVIASFNAG